VIGGTYPRSKGLALVGVFASILAVSALVSIPITPITPVPITLQVLAVFLIAVLLGPRYGALSCLLYLALGAIGLPVFSGAESGIGQLIGPTGGYLVSFPLAVFAGGLLAKDTGSSRRSELIRISSAMAVTLTIVYAVGVLWLSVLYLHGDVYEGVILGAAPFLPFDILKAVVAIPISLRVRGAGLGLPVNSPKRRAPNATTTMVPVPDRPPTITGRG
jgi:biotin transport system substrate-specific component